MLEPVSHEDAVTGLPDDVNAWNERMFRVVMPIVRDAEAARDVCQDVWIRYMEHRPFDADGFSLGGWLTTVARRLALNHVASGQVRFRASVTVDAIDPAATGPSPAEVVGQAQEADRIMSVLASLNPRHARVIELCDAEGRSYAEAGRELDLSESAVTSLLHRARTTFKRRYLLAVAPAWLRALGEAGSVDDVLDSVDPLTPPLDLGDAVERRAHDLFARIAGKWDRIRTSSVPSELDAAVAARARLGSDENALDVGTGTGIVAMHVAPRVRRVVGIDRSLPMLKVAKERVASSGSRNVLMEFGDLLALPVRRDSIDVAFCSLVLRLVERPDDAVANVVRTLRRGGRIVVCDALKSGKNADTGLTAAQLETWFSNAGLSRVTMDTVGERGTGRFVIAVGHRD